MKYVIEQIERRKRRVADHPFYGWVRGASAPLDRRFDFAPALVNFIMAFSDMNKWFMRYPAPTNEYERAINKHTREDETHSKLFVEDWRKLGLDDRLGWTAGETLAWYHAAPETEPFRAHGMQILAMLTGDDDPLVRFALMESIEAWGHVMFSASAEAASQLTRASGQEYRYFGPYHLRRELGHLLAGGKLFEAATLDEGRRGRALALVDGFFDIADDESDRLMDYSRRVTGGGEPAPRADMVTGARGSDEADEPGGRTRGPERLRRLLAERRGRAARHPLFAWMARDGEPLEKLRKIALFWAPDCLGYRDLNAHALGYRGARGGQERAINRWVARLESHHALFLRDWAALEMDDWCGFSASDTLEFYCRSAYSEVQRHSMSQFVKLAFRHAEPALRFWLLSALEASGDAFFAATRALAGRVETGGVRLDYLGDRHAAAHPRLAADPEAEAVEFARVALTDEQEDVAAAMIGTVFDCLERQLSASLEQAAGASPVN